MHPFLSLAPLAAAFLLSIPLAFASPLATAQRAVVNQQIALASYIFPGADPAAWNRLISYPGQKISILVANVLNGPDVQVDNAWDDAIRRAKASNKTVLGYVRTGYLGLGDQRFRTRLGSGEIADWLAQIERDVDTWYELYGSTIGGIFFDEGWWDCGGQLNTYANIYKYINDYTKSQHPGALTVLNPGSPVGKCYENTMDTLLTFENSYERYTTAYQGLDWTPQDPRKIWHVVYNVPVSAIANVTKLANDRGAGFIQLTDDSGANPYDNLPSDAYMQAQMSAVPGGTPLNTLRAPWPAGPAAGTPSNLTSTKADYSSALLTWNAAANALGYNIYIATFKGQTNFLIASTPPTIRSLTIGGLPSGNGSLVFSVRAIGGGGNLSPNSNLVRVLTMGFPSGKSIINPVATPSTSSTIYKADVLVPYGFLRLFIWNSTSTPTTSNPDICKPTSTGQPGGWPIYYTAGIYVCAKYMVEGSSLFRYTGSGGSLTASPSWSWSYVGPVTVNFPVAGQGYTVNWTVPLGTSTMDTGKFVVQGDRLGPFINVFQPNP